MTRSIKEIIERDAHVEGSLSAVARKLLSQNRLSIDQLEQMVDSWASAKSVEETEQLVRRNLERASTGGTIDNLKGIYRFCKSNNVSEATISFTIRKLTVKVQLKKGKFPRISLFF